MADVLDGLSIIVMIGSVGRPRQHQWTGLCVPLECSESECHLTLKCAAIHAIWCCRHDHSLVSCMDYYMECIFRPLKLHQVITDRFFEPVRDCQVRSNQVVTDRFFDTCRVRDCQARSKEHLAPIAHGGASRYRASGSDWIRGGGSVISGS